MKDERGGHNAGRWPKSCRQAGGRCARGQILTPIPRAEQTFDMEGKLKAVFETQSFGDKGFTKREFVVTMKDDMYPQVI